MTATREYDGDVQTQCPQCGGTVDTRRAMRREQMPGGVRILETPCDGCEATYTFEATESATFGPSFQMARV